MTTARQTRQIVRAFHDARTSGDFASAAAHLAPTFRFQSPMLAFDNPSAYIASEAAFRPLVTGFDMISELYGESDATYLFDLHTATSVGTQRTAEHFRLGSGRITSILLIFDASEWRPFLAAIGVIPAAN